MACIVNALIYPLCSDNAGYIKFNNLIKLAKNQFFLKPNLLEKENLLNGMALCLICNDSGMVNPTWHGKSNGHIVNNVSILFTQFAQLALDSSIPATPAQLVPEPVTIGRERSVVPIKVQLDVDAQIIKFQMPLESANQDQIVHVLTTMVTLFK